MTTQFAKASYQEIIDLHTESDKVSVIGIHTPTSDTPRKMFGGFFDQFKKFKYLGCSVSLVPAARLPADPLQVSYEAGEATIDPRDMLNPLMFHGCHGNDMGAILNRLYALNSIDAKKMDSIFQYEADTDDTIDVNGFQLEDLYYKALTDNTWKKAHPQRGFKKAGLRPLVYSMATNHQLLGASALRLNNGNVIMQSTQGLPLEVDYESGTGAVDLYSNISQNDIRFFTPRLTGLGWLDTRNAITSNVVMEDVAVDPTLEDVHAALAQINADQQSEPDLPLVYMGMILLPPAYKTEQYFRMIVNHHFAFKEFRGISFSNTLIDTPAYGNFNDDDWEQGGGEVDPPTPPGPDDPDDPDDPPISDAVVLTLSGLDSSIAIHAGVSDDSIVGFLKRAKTVTVTGGQYDGAVVSLANVSSVNSREPWFAGRIAADNTTVLNQLWIGGGPTAANSANGTYDYDSQKQIYWQVARTFPFVGTADSSSATIADYLSAASESIAGAKSYLLGLMQNGLTTETVVFSDE